MYRPAHSIHENPSLILDLIQEYPLGLLISFSDGQLEINHLPFIAESVGPDLFLFCHLAKANPQWRNLSAPVTVSFQGPHRYISPSMYVNRENVPTWSYAAVQVQGSAEIVADSQGLTEILTKSVRSFEKRNGTDWSYELPTPMQKKLESAIVGLRIRATHIEAKFKLGQNRQSVDDKAVLDFLKASPLQRDQEMYSWMQKTRS
jgi:transcriptional regulator